MQGAQDNRASRNLRALVPAAVKALRLDRLARTHRAGEGTRHEPAGTLRNRCEELAARGLGIGEDVGTTVAGVGASDLFSNHGVLNRSRWGGHFESPRLSAMRAAIHSLISCANQPTDLRPMLIGGAKRPALMSA
jgi:hypothetical protein